MQHEKVPVDASLVRRLVSTQFPQWAHLPIRPVELGGWDNRTFHLGERMTVRLPSAAAYALQVEKEHYWLPRLAPHLPLPIPVQADKVKATYRDGVLEIRLPKLEEVKPKEIKIDIL